MLSQNRFGNVLVYLSKTEAQLFAWEIFENY